MVWIEAILVNSILVYLFKGLPILTPAGWIHAATLGTLLWGSMGWQGWMSVVIYLCLGSLVTKLGQLQKEKRGIAEKRGGRRGPQNVWGSSIVGTGLALLCGAGLEPKELLEIGFAASFTAKLSDTFGSEIGKLWGRKTFLIVNFKPVPPGTEGGISAIGTLASLLGSILMVAFMFVLRIIPSWMIALWVIAIGLISTLFESIIGALFQNKLRWLSNETVNMVQTLLAAILAMICYTFLVR